MVEEHELVPPTSSELPAGPWVVFAPHADDETFGMGGSLLLASQQGIETCVVIVTNGALGGEGDPTQIIERRIQEARAATTALGVTELIFLSQPDRSLGVNPELIEEVKSILARLNPASVFFPSVLEFHPDHRATAQLVWQSIAAMPDFDGDAYSYEISTYAPANMLIDVSSVAAEKYAVIENYASQLVLSKYLALVQAMDTGRTFSLAMDRTAAEAFFRFPDTSGSLSEQFAQSILPYFEGTP